MIRLTFRIRKAAIPPGFCTWFTRASEAAGLLRQSQFALQALLRVRHGLEPFLLAQLTADRATPVFPLVDARERILQVIQEFSLAGGEEKGFFALHRVRPLLHVRRIRGALACVFSRGGIHHRVSQGLELLEDLLLLLEDDLLEVLQVLLAVAPFPDRRLRRFRLRHFHPYGGFDRRGGLHRTRRLLPRLALRPQEFERLLRRRGRFSRFCHSELS